MVRTRAAHRPAPSLFMYPGLTSKPFWSSKDFPYLKNFQDALPTIREEYLAVKAKVDNDYTLKNNEEGLHSGKWDWHSFIQKGKFQQEVCTLAPTTTELLANMPGILHGVPFAYAFFSQLHPGSKIAPHFGPVNMRLRVHLPLFVPSSSSSSSSSVPAMAAAVAAAAEGVNSTSGNNDSGLIKTPACGIRVADEIREWPSDGQAIVFDDAYEHETWNNTTEERVVLLFDIWHPELSYVEKGGMLELFEDARRQGWLS